MELKKLSVKAKKYWLFLNAFWSVIMAIATLLVILLVEGAIKKIVAISLGIPVVLIIGLLIVFPFLKYRFYSYGYDNEKIVIKRGVIFRHSITIPVCQLQDLHLFEGPIMTAFKLRSVEFSTAGSNFSVCCLDKVVSQQIVDDLSVYLKTRLEEKENEKI